MWNNVIMHICGHFLHSAKRYQSGCPALRWQIPSLPPPPPTTTTNRAERVSQPPEATPCPGADCFIQIVTASCVVVPPNPESLPAYKSRGCVTRTADCPRVNLSSDKRGCTNWAADGDKTECSWTRAGDRSKQLFDCTKSRLSNNNGMRHTDVEKRILILHSFGIGSYLDSWSYRRNQKGIVEPNLKKFGLQLRPLVRRSTFLYIV